MLPRESSYHCYVVAYQRLAVVAGLSVELLWRALWHLPREQVRNGFLETVDRLCVTAHHSALTSAQRAKLGGQADRQVQHRAPERHTERGNARLGPEGSVPMTSRRAPAAADATVYTPESYLARIALVRADDLITQHAGKGAGDYGPDYLETLRGEWR